MVVRRQRGSLLGFVLWLNLRPRALLAQPLRGLHSKRQRRYELGRWLMYTDLFCHEGNWSLWWYGPATRGRG
jgi:hypothetical protein